jgi:hypothetical protein
MDILCGLICFSYSIYYVKIPQISNLIRPTDCQLYDPKLSQNNTGLTCWSNYTIQNFSSLKFSLTAFLHMKYTSFLIMNSSFFSRWPATLMAKNMYFHHVILYKFWYITLCYFHICSYADNCICICSNIFMCVYGDFRMRIYANIWKFFYEHIQLSSYVSKESFHNTYYAYTATRM